MADNQPSVSLEPWGPGPAQLNEASRILLQHPQVAKYLKDARYQVLSVTLQNPETKAPQPTPPNRFRLVAYDYTNNRTIVAYSQVGTPGPLEQIEVAEY